jgi:hypothetical protein
MTIAALAAPLPRDRQRPNINDLVILTAGVGVAGPDWGRDNENRCHSTFGLDHRVTVGSMHLRDTIWLVLTLMTAVLAGCNNFAATNQTVPESDSVAQSGPVVQSGATAQSMPIGQSVPIAQSGPPSPPIAQSRPIAQSGAVVQSRPITKSEALSAYIARSVQPCAIAQSGSGAVVQFGTSGQPEPPSGPDPSYRDIVAYCFKATFKDYASYELFEISEPRWVSSIKGWVWLVCVRFIDRGHRRSYALLLNDSAVVDGHYAHQTDNCGSQAYVVFEQMGGLGLPPLH